MIKFKKQIAILLAAFLLQMVFVPCSFAQTSETYSDNFDQHTEDRVLPWSGYPEPAGGSDLFVKSNGAYGQLLSTAGRDGKTALKLSTKMDGNNAGILTKTVSTQTGDEFMMVLDFLLTDFGDKPQAIVGNKRVALGLKSGWGGNPIYIGYQQNETYGSGMFFEKSDGTILAPCHENVWYTLTIHQAATMRRTIVSDDTGAIVVDNSGENNLRAEEAFLPIMLMAFNPTTSQEAGITRGISILIDNAVMSKYNTEINPPSCTSSSVTSGETNVSRNKKLSFKFDQEIFGTATLLKNGVAVAGTQSVISGLDTITLGYSGLLDKNATYEVSFANVTNAAGTMCNTENIEFTTEKIHLLNDVTVSSCLNGANGKINATFTISDPLGYESFTGNVMAIVYRDGKMISVDMIDANGFETDTELSKLFNVSESLQTGDYVSVSLWDLAEGPIPLAFGNFIIE